jgi:hypothetical protein
MRQSADVLSKRLEQFNTRLVAPSTAAADRQQSRDYTAVEITGLVQKAPAGSSAPGRASPPCRT